MDPRPLRIQHWQLNPVWMWYRPIFPLDSHIHLTPVMYMDHRPIKMQHSQLNQMWIWHQPIAHLNRHIPLTLAMYLNHRFLLVWPMHSPTQMMYNHCTLLITHIALTLIIYMDPKPLLIWPSCCPVTLLYSHALPPLKRHTSLPLKMSLHSKMFIGKG